MTEPRPVWQQALQLAKQGVPVFPCWLDKTPATGLGGLYNATTDTSRDFKLWFQEGHRLIGIPTGAASGIAVIDIDPAKGGFEWLHRNEPRLAGITRTHDTRSGGWHLLFKWPEDMRNSAGRIAPGVDVRAEGGYFIFWPAHGCKVPRRSPARSTRGLAGLGRATSIASQQKLSATRGSDRSRTREGVWIRRAAQCITARRNGAEWRSQSNSQ